jgi:hypothetical protein
MRLHKRLIALNSFPVRHLEDFRKGVFDGIGTKQPVKIVPAKNIIL